MVDRKTKLIFRDTYNRSIGRFFGAGINDIGLSWEIELARCGSWEEGNKYCRSHAVLCKKADKCKESKLKGNTKMMPGDSSNGEDREWNEWS